MGRLEDGVSRADVAGGDEPKAAHDARGHIREDVAVEVERDYHIELLGVQHQLQSLASKAPPSAAISSLNLLRNSPSERLSTLDL